MTSVLHLLHRHNVPGQYLPGTTVSAPACTLVITANTALQACPGDGGGTTALEMAGKRRRPYSANTARPLLQQQAWPLSSLVSAEA